MYLNKAILVGNITRDPELKALPSGIKVCSFSIATNRVWKDNNGAKQEAVDFHNIVVFGKQAESTAQYMKKGSQVLIEGRMQTRSWEKDGAKHYRTEVVADNVQFGNKAAGAPQTRSELEDFGVDTDEKKPEQGPVPMPAGVEYPEEEINPEDIPF